MGPTRGKTSLITCLSNKRCGRRSRATKRQFDLTVTDTKGAFDRYALQTIISAVDFWITKVRGTTMQTCVTTRMWRRCRSQPRHSSRRGIPSTQNGDTSSPVLPFLATSTAGSPSFSFSGLSLVAGDTLDFVVGNLGDHISDNTPLTVQFLDQTSNSVPEPSTALLLAAAVLALRRSTRQKRLAKQRKRGCR